MEKELNYIKMFMHHTFTLAKFLRHVKCSQMHCLDVSGSKILMCFDVPGMTKHT